MKYSVNPKEIVFANLTPEEGVLLNLKTKNYYRLNETAQWIWEKLAKGLSQEKIIQELCSEFSVDPENAKRDVCGLMEELQTEKFFETFEPKI